MLVWRLRLARCSRINHVLKRIPGPVKFLAVSVIFIWRFATTKGLSVADYRDINLPVCYEEVCKALEYQVGYSWCRDEIRAGILLPMIHVVCYQLLYRYQPLIGLC